MIDIVKPSERTKVTVSHRLRPMLIRALTQYAQDRGVSRSVVIESALHNLPEMSTYIKKEKEAYAKEHKNIVIDTDFS